jgi:hypothetical protein
VGFPFLGLFPVCICSKSKHYSAAFRHAKRLLNFLRSKRLLIEQKIYEVL